MGTGDVYAGTARGVDRLKPETGEFKHFGLADGLAGSEVIAAFRDRDGALWFGTFTGISRLAPPPNIASGPPTVWIGGLRTRGLVHRLEPLGERNVSLHDLGPAENQVQIDYFGLSPASGELLRYQYTLGRNGLGVDDTDFRTQRPLCGAGARLVSVHCARDQCGRPRQPSARISGLHHPVARLAAVVVPCHECVARDRLRLCVPSPSRVPTARDRAASHADCQRFARRRGIEPHPDLDPE